MTPDLLRRARDLYNRVTEWPGLSDWFALNKRDLRRWAKGSRDMPDIITDAAVAEALEVRAGDLRAEAEEHEFLAREIREKWKVK